MKIYVSVFTAIMSWFS